MHACHMHHQAGGAKGKGINRIAAAARGMQNFTMPSTVLESPHKQSVLTESSGLQAHKLCPLGQPLKFTLSTVFM